VNNQEPVIQSRIKITVFNVQRKPQFSKGADMKLLQAVHKTRRTSLIFAALAIVTTVAARQVQAADFWIIIANLNDTRTPHAQVDASIDTRSLANGPVAVLFDVFRADARFAPPSGL